MKGHVVVTFNVHKDGRITDVTVARPSSIEAFTLSARNAILASNPTVPLPPEYPDEQGVLHRHLLLQREPRNAMTRPSRTQLAGPAADARRSRRAGIPARLPPGPRGLNAEARRHSRRDRDRQERARHRARRAVRRGDRQLRLDRRLPRLRHRHRQGAAAEQHGIPHHLVDVADPIEEYSAARYAREAAAVIRDITGRGRLPILVGGTGLYYRALTRGFFPGPGRDTALRGAARAGRGTQGRRASPSLAGARRSGVGRAHPARATSSGSSARSRSTWSPGGRSPRTSPTRPRRCPSTTSPRSRSPFRPPKPRRAWPAASTRSSSAACWTRSAGCSRPVCRRPHIRSPDWCIDRRSSTCTACATSARHAS